MEMVLLNRNQTLLHNRKTFRNRILLRNNTKNDHSLKGPVGEFEKLVVRAKFDGARLVLRGNTADDGGKPEDDGDASRLN